MRQVCWMLAGVALATAPLAACSDGASDAAPTTTTEATTTSTTIASTPELTLLDPGAEPRSPLRISYTPGDVVTIDFTVDQSIDQRLWVPDPTKVGMAPTQRFDSPPITQGLTYTIIAVDGIGRATFTVEITSARAQTEGTELSAEAALLLEAELQPLVGLTGEGRVDARGVVDQFAMDLPQDLDRELAEQIATLDRQLRSFGPSLPREPVGPGAQWGVTVDATIGGATITTTTTYTLTEQTDELMTYTATISGQADTQPFLVPGHDATQSTLTSASSTGTSTGTQSLTGLGFTLRTEVSTAQEVSGPEGSNFEQDIETDVAARASTP